MIYLLTICIAQFCAPHYVTAFGADGFGNANFVELGARTDCYGARVSLSGSGGTITATRRVPDKLFQGNFQ